MTLPAGTRLGPYEVLSPLGQGGMGEVYLAEDPRLGRRVAIKVLPAELASDDQARKRLFREARAAAGLDHPGICAVYEVSEEAGRGYIVMQYVEGQTLASRLHGGPLPWREVLPIATQMADAIAEAHSRGIIHRDIKPQNVMVTSRGVAKVMDFGLAKSVVTPAAVESRAETDIALTNRGAILGTVPYMSPEQLRNEPLDERTDVFSFGAVLYEMLSGRPPFADTSTATTIAAVLTRDPPPLASGSSVVPAALERIVRKSLSKDREQRYRTMRELAEDLSELREAPESVPAAASTKSRRPPRALRVILACAVVAALAAAALAYRLLGRRTVATTPPAIRSLAVLPLEDLSGDPSQEYFADGMTDALISKLAQIGALRRVISRTSVMRYKGSGKSLPEIADELDVDAVVEGTIQRADGRVRVSTKLVPAATDSPLWAREYERDLSDVLKLQSELARAVAEEIRIQVTPEERARLASAPAINPAAHEAYLLGRHHLRTNEEDLRQAIGHFERATRVAPEYAAAYAGLSNAWSMRGVWGARTRNQVASFARDAARKAVALDPNLPEAFLALSEMKLYDWDWTGAEEDLRRAIALDPNSADAHRGYADLLMGLERHEEAIREIQRAEQLDPLSSTIQSRYARVLWRARKYAEAVPHLQRAIDLDPNPGNVMPYWILGDVSTEMGRYAEAMESFRKAESHGARRQNIQAEMARIYALTGRPEEARRILDGLKVLRSPEVAYAHAALGDKDEAFAVLFRLVDDRGDLANFVAADPPLESLHSDPRWSELRRRMNLPPK